MKDKKQNSYGWTVWGPKKITQLEKEYDSAIAGMTAEQLQSECERIIVNGGSLASKWLGNLVMALVLLFGIWAGSGIIGLIENFAMESLYYIALYIVIVISGIMFLVNSNKATEDKIYLQAIKKQLSNKTK